MSKILAVVRQEDEASYLTAPRHVLTMLPTIEISSQSSELQLSRIHSTVQHLYLGDYLSPSCPDVILWLLHEETGEPILNLTGLLELREGKRSQADLQLWNELLLPQITMPQTIENVTVEYSAWLKVDFDLAVNKHGYVAEVLTRSLWEDLCVDLDHYELTHFRCTKHKGHLRADIRHTLEVPAPFSISEPVSPAQSNYLRAKAEEQIHELMRNPENDSGGWRLCKDWYRQVLESSCRVVPAIRIGDSQEDGSEGSQISLASQA